VRPQRPGDGQRRAERREREQRLARREK
jgi:hypothetical protein